MATPGQSGPSVPAVSTGDGQTETPSGDGDTPTVIVADSPPEPLTGDALIAWLVGQSEQVRAQIAELDRVASEFQALPAETYLPPAELEPHLQCGDLNRPQVVEPCRERLARERAQLVQKIHEQRERTAALRAAWTPEPPKRRRRGRRAPKEPVPTLTPVAQARIDHSELERTALERKDNLLAEIRAYLQRSQPVRQRAHEEQDALQRQLQEEAKRAEAERERANAARARALDEQKQAVSLAESLLSAESAFLEGVAGEQAEFRRTLLTDRSEQAREITAFQRFLATLKGTEDADRRYEALVLELDRLQRAAFQIQLQQWHDPHTAPAPGQRLSREVRSLGDDLASERAVLEDMRANLFAAARNLDKERSIRIEERSQLFYEQAGALAQKRVELWPQLSAELRASKLRYDEHTALELEREIAHITIEAMHWLQLRHGQALRTPGILTDLSQLGQLVWWFVKIALILLALRFAMRQWDRWMVATAEFLGTNLDLAGWGLLLVRVTDFARSFGPPLLVLLTAEFLYRLLGADGAVPEVQVIYILVFWIAGLRFQLRLIERIARALGTLIAEREARLDYDRELQADEVLDQGASEGSEPGAATGAAASSTPSAGAQAEDSQTELHLHIGATSYPRLEPATELFIRCWRAVTRYAAVAFILLGLANLAVGRATFYALATQILWWGTVFLAIYCLRIFRPWIVREYVKRSPNDGWLTEITRKHAPRFYGISVLLIALFIVLFRQVARFGRRNLSDLDATKRLLAYLFRRRVEKHAQEHGRVLIEPHELPERITKHFPTGPLNPESRPIRPPFLDEIKQAFDHWQAHKVEGSVAVVGGAGMGKSTALRQLERALGESVPVYKVPDKYTHAQGLFTGLARLLELPRVPTSVSTFVAELIRHLEANDRQVVALDNCHNFFLRQVGGFAAWEAFTRIVNQSSHRLFWVMSFNDVSWVYLQNIANGVAHFRRVVRIPPWTDEELRRMILTRMRRARYRTNFTDLLVTRLEGMKESTQIVRTSQGYFRLLWDFTNGNPRIASYFWLRSLVPDSDKRRVRVHLFASPQIEELEQLPDDMAFVLAAVVEHENITADELAAVSRTSIESARFALQYCCERGYMWRNPSTERTKLTTQWQQPIIRYLKRRHLLYS